MKKQTGQDALSWQQVKKYLPSRKVGTFIGGTLAVVVLILIALSARGVDYDSKNLRVVTVGEIIKEDSDGDGVPDWEESLFGTNPNEVDSDGDGMPDSSEIAAKKDAIAAENGYNPNTEYALNETDKFARELFVTYTALSNKGTLNGTAAQNIAGAALSQTVQKLPQVVVHSRAELKVVPSTEQSNLAYKKAVVLASQTKYGSIATELPLISQGIIESNSDILRDAAKNAKAYNAYTTSLLSMSVPVNQVENHIRLLNDVEYIASILPQIEALEDDSIKGLPLYTLYSEIYQDIFKTYEAIGKTK